jgi:hypothetical protein
MMVMCKTPHAFGYVSVLFFVVYIVFGSLIMLNLFIGEYPMEFLFRIDLDDVGVIVTSMEEAMKNQESTFQQEAKIKGLLSKHNVDEKQLKQIRKAFQLVDLDESGQISVSEFRFALEQAKIPVKESHLGMVFRVTMPDFTGMIHLAEFAEFCIEMRILPYPLPYQP